MADFPPHPQHLAVREGAENRKVPTLVQKDKKTLNDSIIFSLLAPRFDYLFKRKLFGFSDTSAQKQQKSVGECVRIKAKKDVKDIFMTEEREREIKKVFFANIKSSFRFACFGCLVSSTY